MSQSSSVSIRVSFTDAEGKTVRIRIPALYANSWVKSNFGFFTQRKEVQFYAGWMLLVDRRANLFRVVANPLFQPFLVLCAGLHRIGLHWEAGHLKGRTQSSSVARMSQTPFQDPAQFQDRHLLPCGSFF